MEFFKLVLFLMSSCVVFGEILDIGHGSDFLDDVSFGADEKNDRLDPLTSTVARTIKRYYCSVNDITKDRIKSENIPLVYGANAWKFPLQDVNLRLSYPLANSTTPPAAVITSVEVILNFDGRESQGFVTDGGIMQDHISLSFVMRNISQLGYKFWLHGTATTDYPPVPGRTMFCNAGDSTFGVDMADP